MPDQYGPHKRHMARPMMDYFSPHPEESIKDWNKRKRMQSPTSMDVVSDRMRSLQKEKLTLGDLLNNLAFSLYQGGRYKGDKGRDLLDMERAFNELTEKRFGKKL